MKQLLTAIFILLSLSSYSQGGTFNAGGKLVSANSDSALTLGQQVSLTSDTTKKFGLASINGNLWFYDRNVGFWKQLESSSNKVNVITTPNSTDYPTTGAVNGFVASSIAGKVNIADSLTAYVTPKNLRDTSTLLRSLIRNGGIDTTYQKAFPLMNGSTFLSHSIGVGFNAAGGTHTAYPYFTTNYSGVASYTNLSVSGVGVRNQYWRYVQINDASPKLVPISVMLGINEIRIGSDTVRRFQHIRAGFRAIAAAHFTNTIQFYRQGVSGAINTNVTSSDASNFFTPVLDTLADFSSRAWWYQRNDPNNAGMNIWIKKNITANESVTINNVLGKNIAIGTWGCDGVRTIMSRIAVTVDGVSYGTYQPNNKTYSAGSLVNPDFTGSFFGSPGFLRLGLVNDAIIVNGLKDTSHTVVLTFLDGGTMGAWDYIAGLKQPQAAAMTPLYWWDIGRCNAAGYNYQGFSFTQALVDSANSSSIRDLEANFPSYPILNVKTNKYFNPLNSAQIQSDGLHPTAAGDSAMALAYNDIIDSKKIQAQYYSAGVGITNTNGVLSNNLLTGRAGGQRVIGGLTQREGLTLKASTFGASLIAGDSAFIFRSGNATGFDYLASIRNNGLFDVNSIKTTSVNNVDGGGLSLGGFGIVSAVISHTNVTITAGTSITSSTTTQVPLQVLGRSGQTNNLLQIDPNGASSGSFLRVNAAGVTTIRELNLAPTTTGTAGTDSILVKTSGGVVRAVSPTFYTQAATTAIGGSVSTAVTAVQTFVVTIPTQANANYEVSVQGRNALSVGGWVTNQTTTSFDYVLPSAVTGTVAFHWILVP